MSLIANSIMIYTENSKESKIQIVITKICEFRYVLEYKVKIKIKLF